MTLTRFRPAHSLSLFARMNLRRIQEVTSALLAGALLLAPRPVAAQSTTNPPPAAVATNAPAASAPAPTATTPAPAAAATPAATTPAVRVNPALRLLPTRTIRSAPARAATANATEADADGEVPAAAKPAKGAKAADAPDLATAIRTMNFDRAPSALMELVKAQQAGGKLNETERFKLAVLLGDWPSVGKALKALPAADAMPAYTRLLDSLAANSQSAGQFFQQSSARNLGIGMVVDEMDESGQPQPQKKEDKRGLFLSEDFYAVIAAAPGDLDVSHVPSLAKLAKVALGPGGRQDFLERLQKGLQGFGGTTPAGQKLAAQLLSALGWMADAGPYLPLKREQWDSADTLMLVLTLEYFTQTGVQQRDERQLKHAAELCAFMMQTSRFSADDRGLFKQATDRFVKLLPALEADDAEQLIRENFLTQPEIMNDLILALGESGRQAQQGTDLNARGQSLATQSILLHVLEGKKSALPEAVNVLVMNWLGEAEQTYRFGGLGNLNAVDPDNPYMLYRPILSSSRNREVKTLPSEIVLSRAPSPTLIRRLNQGLAQRVNLTLLKVNLINPKEPVTIEALKGYLKEHPGQEKELCQDYLAAWVKKRSVPAEDPNVIRMRNLGYNMARQQATGIPLTRLRQNQNVAEFKMLLDSLRALSPEPLDAASVIQGFMAIHSGAEVYRLEDIEAIFGPPEKMNRAELMGLVTGMRTKLREQWQDPKTQQDAGTNRTEQEAKDEVSRGYRTALALVKRGLTPENADWKQYIVRGQLFFDAAEYEFARQIKLTDYVNLRDESFGSYKKAAEIYAGKLADLPRGQWTMEPYQMWFFVMLGASDLSQLTRAAARSDPGLKQIGDAMRALPGEVAEGHLKLFGAMLGDLLPQVPANMRQRFLSAGLQVVGADHPSANAATEAMKNYQELLNEVELRLTVDGPTRVGHGQPFGVFLGLEHTRQLAREAGGFSKYLQNLANQTRTMMIGLPAGQKQINYRDEFAKNVHAALDETFDVVSITFHDAGVRPLDLPREGWQETPLAYVVLRAKEAAVDRIPSIQLDMDFSDTSGQVVLPVRSQVQPLDAKDATPPPRPCPNLALTMTMDERDWRKDGKVVVEVAAKAQGVIPPHQELFDFAREGFDVEVSDNGLSVTQFESDGKQKTAQADRNWQFTYLRKKDLRGDAVLKFPTLKAGIQTTNVDYKHYQDADLVVVDAKEALAGVPLHSGVSSGLRNLAIVVALAAVGVAAWLLLRSRQRQQVGTKAVLAVPAQLTPFSVVAFLRRVQREGSARLDAAGREALKAQIREIEAACFSPAASAAGHPDLEAIARKWLQAVH
jgi:hypothetical protein